MGVLNVTPDSFSDGGAYLRPDQALQHALALQSAGADILDVGAESTRPGSERISEHEEIERLIPVLKRLKGKIDIPISVDTYKPAVAALAIEHGAAILNDVSGLTWEPDLARIARDSGAGLILNHMRGTPETWLRLPPLRDVMGEIASELEACVHRARRAGVDLAQIVVDPGIGFGKRKEQNSEILARLGELSRLLLPVMVGPSRKSFLAQQTPEALEFATAAAVTAGVLNGACIVRVHNVAAIVPVVQTVDAIVAAIPEPRVEEPVRPRGARVVDLDLRPEREYTGPPRPVLKKPEQPVESAAAPSKIRERKPVRPLGQGRPRNPRSPDEGGGPRRGPSTPRRRS